MSHVTGQVLRVSGQVSCITFLISGGASWLRISYQRGPPILILKGIHCFSVSVSASVYRNKEGDICPDTQTLLYTIVKSAQKQTVTCYVWIYIVCSKQELK